MKTWHVPITLVEYGRAAIVQAETRTEAIAKVRRYEWDELSDQSGFKVTIVGKTEEVT